ncbi:hypothetical protein [Candidatus Mycobacterium methanotrophicum]|uniref:Secreted protein n=1 Tax=Candidatus Mycobacterium methanotrophicum TaxID=2943498 RepID=A0ABY4QS37_9MYCO|nr:hypothetical protein [Candidatus Mycobacterium methanotrophicum]UQX13481.1 hypothetical protein M5I08_25095 [Candidatus Mycobacterium methanotrophicum]
MMYQRTRLLQRGLVAVALALGALAASIPVAHADDPPGDPVQCKDSQGTFANSHICRYSDGSVWSCVNSFLPVVGPPCSRVNVALRPDFWTTP